MLPSMDALLAHLSLDELKTARADLVAALLQLAKGQTANVRVQTPDVIRSI